MVCDLSKTVIDYHSIDSPPSSSATNRLIQAKDHGSVQINIAHVDANGTYTVRLSLVPSIIKDLFTSDSGRALTQLLHSADSFAKVVRETLLLLGATLLLSPV